MTSNELLENHIEMVPSLNELVSGAIMNNEPLIIVEGCDDVSYYNEIANQLEKRVNVKAVETIKEFIGKSGCVHVIKAIERVENVIGQTLDRHTAEKYILGIIDGDVREYRNDHISDSSLFLVLKVYSIESHFDIDEMLIQFIKNHTYVDNRLLENNRDEILNYVKQSVAENYRKLWYISLEALKCACDKNYNESLFKYKKDKSDSVIRYFKSDQGKNGNEINQLMEKRSELDEYAREKGISFLHIKKVAKGKWLLEVYIYSIIKKIKELTNACKEGMVKRCPYCLTTQPASSKHCQYRARINFAENNMKSFFYQNVYRCQEVEYIYQRINQLGS